jgi:hypothetical protein
MNMGNIISKTRRPRDASKPNTDLIQSQPPAKSQKTLPSFFVLPRELRDQILSYVIHDAQWAPDYRQHAGFGPQSVGIDVNWVYCFYQLILVSRQFQSEVLDAVPQNIVARGVLTLYRYLQILKPINGLGCVKDVNIYLEFTRTELDKPYALMCASTLELCKDIRIFVTCMGETYPNCDKFLKRDLFVDAVYYDYKKESLLSVVELVDITWRDRAPLQSAIE